MSPITILIMLILCIMILALPKKYAILPLLIGSCLISISPRIIIAGADFSVIRIIILTGTIRLLVRGDYKNITLTKLDKYLLLWVITSVLTGTLLFGNFSGFVNRAGLAFDAFGFYFITRSFISEGDDIVRLYNYIAIIFILLSVLMLIEKITGRNPIYYFGGAKMFAGFRDGKIRACGPFAHSILAGTAGAGILPYVLALYFEKKKFLSYISVISAFIIVFSSGSSGPIMSLFFAILSMVSWIWKKKIPVIRITLFFTVILLEIVMESHVWYLLGRIDLTGSSTGWHRAELITSALEHIKEWWFIGTTYTRHWMPTGVSWNPNHTDITNHYILLGVNGGLPSMLLFILMIVRGFKSVGLALQNNHNKNTTFCLWAIGCVLFTHMATFISVAYFDQSVVFIYMVLAIASSAESIYCGLGIVNTIQNKRA